MRTTMAIAWKELQVYFTTPTAYIIGAMFLIYAGIIFVLDITSQTPEASVRSFILPSSTFFILLSPLLTMRLLAEEQKLGTMELLLTAPVRDWEVVIGKYLASLGALIATIALTVYYVIMIYSFGDPDTGPVLSAYLGVILYGAAALSIGLLASSLSSNQLVSSVVGMGTLLVLTFVDEIGARLSGVPADIINNISLRVHFSDFSRGIIDTSNIVYYISIIAVVLFLTVRSLETRRWR
ncbi:MAG: ABC transporter permease subunit [Chloroflexi bacterium]|nr:ABC transporter permease subunit [Chloroflexota bacterium]